MVSGYLGGGLDRILVLLIDTFNTLPVLLLSVVLAFLPGCAAFPMAAAALCGGVTSPVFPGGAATKTAQ